MVETTEKRTGEKRTGEKSKKVSGVWSENARRGGGGTTQSIGWD